MEREAKQFLKSFGIFTAGLILIAALLFSTLLQKWYFPMFPVQFLVIALVTGIIHLFLIKVAQQNIRKFNTVFMALVAIKLLIYFAFILISLLLDRSNAIVFVLTFLVLYICFTIFEVQQILRTLKK